MVEGLGGFPGSIATHDIDTGNAHGQIAIHCRHIYTDFLVKRHAWQIVFAHVEDKADVIVLGNVHDGSALTYQFAHLRENFRDGAVSSGQQDCLLHITFHFLHHTLHTRYLSGGCHLVFATSTFLCHLILAASSLLRSLHCLKLGLSLIAFLSGDDTFII